ncbi:MAG: sugar phosphate nucleotidyltransferase [Flavobacterium sp.]|uniref:sugar phosphate nucleotidyltransferase n=1 Tax=Flavobacterium sp. TaxID=239 RepID=UPI0026153C78|nr:sugar phosphate nucleotidyltransferase [Flavobacterium sp.]MDD5151734.1 sugar phosphate nucleotidyltransferase [Flavobacterium sp.]
MKQIELNDPLFITVNFTVLESLERMDTLNRKLLIVIKDDKFYGVLSIGDIQRAIINKYPLENSIETILRKEITVCQESDSAEFIKQKMIEFRTECMPILNEYHNLMNVVFWEDIFESQFKRKNISLNVPVIIMAGGQGTRLKPLTNIFPKPLLPINEKTIIEDIMDRFVAVGCKEFYLSVNYKADTIKSYFNVLQNPDYIIHYFEENKPLGTAGSMFLIKNKIDSTFFVSNCDILIDQDLEEIYNYHKQNENDITVVSAVKRYKIPYGTIQTKENGILSQLDEKPELVFQINTGMYILEPKVLQFIPEDEFFHITHLIELVRENEGKVGVFPIAENSWQDIGNWDDYSKILKIKL